MDTILIIRDSVACCVNKTAEICQPCIKEVGASWQDVVFVGIICAAILIIALFAICKYYNDKEKEACDEDIKKVLKTVIAYFYLDKYDIDSDFYQQFDARLKKCLAAMKGKK